MSAIQELNPDDYSTAEKVAIRSILSGSSVCDAANIAGISESIIEAVFTRYSQALKRVMVEAGERFISNSLASSPTDDPIDAIMLELGWQSDEDFDDTAPDYLEKQTAKHQPSSSSKVDPLWSERSDMMVDIMRELGLPPLEEIDDTAPDYLEKQEQKRKEAKEREYEPAQKKPIKDVYDIIMEQLGWQSLEDFDDTAPDYFEKQDAKLKAFPCAAQTHTDQVAQYEVTPELAESRRIATEAFTATIEDNPAIKADDDLRIALSNIAWDMADIMAGMPADQQQAFIDRQIADWLDANADAIKSLGVKSAQNANDAVRCENEG